MKVDGQGESHSLSREQPQRDTSLVKGVPVTSKCIIRHETDPQFRPQQIFPKVATHSPNVPWRR